MSIETQVKELLGDSADAEMISKIVDFANSDAELIKDKEVKGLLENKTKLLDQMSKLKKNQMPDGFDSDEFETYKTEKAKFDADKIEIEDKRLKDEGQWEHLKETLITKNRTVVEELTVGKDTEIKSLRNALDKELIENAAIKAIDKENGNSFFLLPHIKDSIKTVSKDGMFSVEVLDSDGNARIDAESGDPFTIHQLVAEMKSNSMFAPAFPNGNSGSGNDANAGGGGSNVVNPWKQDTKNITEQARLNRDNPVLAAQMRKSAGV